MRVLAVCCYALACCFYVTAQDTAAVPSITAAAPLTPGTGIAAASTEGPGVVRPAAITTPEPSAANTTETPAPTPAPESIAPPTEPPAPKPTPKAERVVATNGKAAPSPTPKAKYVPPPIPVAAADSSTFQLVPNVMCPEPVKDLVYSLYTKNRALFDLCAADSDYQIFPFSGQRPTHAQITAMASSRACTALFTACVMSNLPQCDIGDLGLKAVTESLLKVRIDLEMGRPAPDTKRFHDLHIWRRNVNLAQAAGVPFGSDAPLYAEYARNLWKALSKYSVRVRPDLTIDFDFENEGSRDGEIPVIFYARNSSISLEDVMANVHAQNGASGSGTVDGGPVTAGTKPAGTMSSSSTDQDSLPQPDKNVLPLSAARATRSGAATVLATALAGTFVVAALG